MAHVLLVNDDISICDLLKYALEEEGHEVTQAFDGTQGWAVIRSSLHPMVVLLDTLMPEMTGIDVMKLVLADGELVRRHQYFMMASYVSWVEDWLRQAFPDPEDRWPIIHMPFDLNTVMADIAEAARRLEAGR